MRSIDRSDRKAAGSDLVAGSDTVDTGNNGAGETPNGLPYALAYLVADWRLAADECDALLAAGATGPATRGRMRALRQCADALDAVLARTP